MAPKKGSIPWNKGMKGCQVSTRRGVPLPEDVKRKISESCMGRVPPNKGVPMSEETKKRLSKSCKKHWADPKNRMKLVVSHLGQKAWCKGLPVPDEVKAKISETKKSQNRKHSEEHKRKISEGQMGEKNQFFGRHHTEETKEAIAEKLRGRKCPEEVKRKLSLANKGRTGRPLADSAKKKLSLRMSGSRHPQWKGGIAAEPYCPVWLDKDFKSDIKERDNHKCQNPLCFGKSRRLAIHHINYNKKDCRPVNLITVCTSCNSRANHKRKYWEQFYQDIMFYNQQLVHEQGLLKTIKNIEHPAKLYFIAIERQERS